MADRYIEVNGTANCMVCTECGGVVFYKKQHDEFHDQLSSVARQASEGDYAASMLRPIG